MKVCVREHHVPSFGTIPVGSLWEDESPYVVEADCFAEVLDEKPEPTPKPPSRPRPAPGRRYPKGDD